MNPIHRRYALQLYIRCQGDLRRYPATTREYITRVLVDEMLEINHMVLGVKE